LAEINSQKGQALNNLFSVAGQFESTGKVLNVQEYGSGNVNDTFLVTLDSSTDEHVVLQRINRHVFRRPELIVLNIRTFTRHVQEKLRREQNGASRRWETPRIIPARDGQDFYVDAEGEFWRAISFVAGSTSLPRVESAEHARQVGYALGKFHGLISDLETEKLHDTLEGFHITPGYLRHYDEVLAAGNKQPDCPEVRYGLRCVKERRAWASVLEDAKDQNTLVLRPIHGDPKVDNVMIDVATRQAVSIVDLDTVKPGLVHYDIGDCLRSCCNPLGEETHELDAVCFETDLCRAILQGYLSVAQDFLSESDYAFLYDAVRLIAFELGLRFFTDYLEGNVYFKARHPDHNLWRALVQFKLAESIEAQERAIRASIDDLR
jgi:Ser/Thr protein kinase RdoA (MazF antagonist)